MNLTPLIKLMVITIARKLVGNITRFYLYIVQVSVIADTEVTIGW